MNNQIKILSVLFILWSFCTNAQVHNKLWKSITESQDEKWFASAEAVKIAENVLLYQRNIGGWPKNIQMQNVLSDSKKKILLNLKSNHNECTIDNGATCQEMIFLAKIYQQHPDEIYKQAFLKGINYLLEAQYENGGWPQFFPLKEGYYSHITYNDDSIANILFIFKQIKEKGCFYTICPCSEVVKKIETAFDKGIDCILKTQYKQNGELTGWCAQYDEVTLVPAKARAYELPSLSGMESAKITLLLMSIDHPKKEVVDAVEAAVRWFEKTKITGIKVERVAIKGRDKKDRIVVKTENDEPLWARFMELEDNKPFFCDRDGIKKATLAEIGFERRSGYNWYPNEPIEVLKKYQDWKTRIK